MTFRKKVCSATIFFCIIAHILLGYFTKAYTGSNDGYWFGFLFYILVPVMPFLVGLKKFHISYEFGCLLIYLIVCITVQVATKDSSSPLQLWHPGWVIFLTIPIYHIFKSIPTRNRKTKYTYYYDEDDD